MKRSATTTDVVPNGELKRYQALQALLGGVLCRPIMDFLGPIDARVLTSTTKELQSENNLPYISKFHLLLLKVTMIMSKDFEIVTYTCMDEHRLKPDDRDELDMAIGLGIEPYIHKLNAITIQANGNGIEISMMTRGILSMLPTGAKSSAAMNNNLRETMSRYSPNSISIYEKMCHTADMMEGFVDMITHPIADRTTDIDSFICITKEIILEYGQTVMCVMMALCMCVRWGSTHWLSDHHISGIFNRGAEDLGWALKHRRMVCKTLECECWRLRDKRTPRLNKRARRALSLEDI